MPSRKAFQVSEVHQVTEKDVDSWGHSSFLLESVLKELARSSFFPVFLPPKFWAVEIAVFCPVETQSPVNWKCSLTFKMLLKEELIIGFLVTKKFFIWESQRT